MEGVCVMDVTRPESNVVDKGEERTDCPSFKEYLKTQERWSESSCHSLRRVWTSAFWCYSFHFQTKRRPPRFPLHFTGQNSSWGEARGPLQALRTPFRSQGCQPAVGGEVGLRGDLNPRWHPQPMIRNKTHSSRFHLSEPQPPPREHDRKDLQLVQSVSVDLALSGVGSPDTSSQNTLHVIQDNS